MNKRLAIKVFILILTAVAVLYLAIHYNLYLFFTSKDSIINFVQKFHPYDEIVFILLQIVQVIAVPIPGELTGFIGGYLYGPVLGTVYSTIGLTIGSWLAFILAHFCGMPLLGKIVKPAVFDKFDYFIEHQGLLVSFFLFLIPCFPKDYLCYIMGMSRMPVGIFLGISASGRLLGTIMLSITGGTAYKGHYFLMSCFIGVGIIIFAAVCFYQDRLLCLLKKKSEKPN